MSTRSVHLDASPMMCHLLPSVSRRKHHVPRTQDTVLRRHVIPMNRKHRFAFSHSSSILNECSSLRTQKSAPRGRMGSLVQPGILSPRRRRKHTRPSAQSPSRLQSPSQCRNPFGGNQPMKMESPTGMVGDVDGAGEAVGFVLGEADGTSDGETLGGCEGCCDLLGV